MTDDAGRLADVPPSPLPGGQSGAIAPAVTPPPTAPAPAPASPAPAADPTVMSLVDHLTELRSRIVRVVLAVLVGSAVGFWVADDARRILVTPLPDGAERLQVLGPGDAFAITLRIALVIGVILAMPVVLYQVWAFVSPGLTPSERRIVRPWVPLALIFFAFGVFLAWAVLPEAVEPVAPEPELAGATNGRVVIRRGGSG